MYRSLLQFDLSPAELALVKQALTDSEAKKPAVDLETWEPKIEALAKDRQARVTEKEKAESVAYLAKAASEPGVVKTDSGLIYHELKAGTGASPKATDTVKVNYRGTFINGTEFDSSYKRNEPAEFPLNGVIPCWTEGVQKMKVGGKASLVCPSSLAYGDQGRPSIPGEPRCSSRSNCSTLRLRLNADHGVIKTNLASWFWNGDQEHRQITLACIVVEIHVEIHDDSICPVAGSARSERASGRG